MFLMFHHPRKAFHDWFDQFWLNTGDGLQGLFHLRCKRHGR
jgi:hypothetical protein